MQKKLNVMTYIKSLFLAISIFIIYHLLIWTFFTSQIFDPRPDVGVGDLGRMSYQYKMLHHKEPNANFNRTQLFREDLNNTQIDIITIGDSFSDGGGSKAPNYQDYLASKYNLNVVSVNPIIKYTSLEIMLGLYNSGYLEKTRPRAIVIESGVKLITGRYARTQQENLNIKEPTINSKKSTPYKQEVNIINTANYKLPYYNLMYNFKENAQKKVYKFELKNELFSIEDKEHILIHCDDIRNLNHFTSNNIQEINKQFNSFANKLKKLNIKLYFMACVDKYDLYYPYLKNNKHPKNHFFDLIRPLEKDYYFVDTKKILLPLVNDGIEDVYYVDDTHWSRIGRKAVAMDSIFNELSIKESE